MQDGAAEINLNEDLVLSRRWRQLKVIVLKKNKRRRRPESPRARLMDNYSSQGGRITPPQQFTAANLELFTVNKLKVRAN